RGHLPSLASLWEAARTNATVRSLRCLEILTCPLKQLSAASNVISRKDSDTRYGTQSFLSPACLALPSRTQARRLCWTSMHWRKWQLSFHKLTCTDAAFS